MTTKAEVDLASYRKAPRLLGQHTVEALAPGGGLAVVLDAVKANRDLRLDIRERRFNIYYRGGSLLCIDGRRSPWTMRFDKKYLAGQMGTLPKLPVIYSSADDAHAWVDAFPQLMRVMDRWWLANPRAGRDYCQSIARDNSPHIENPSADFHVFDIEYQWAQRRFDLVAAHRRVTDTDSSGWQEPDLVLVEVKSDLDTCTGGSGLVAHTRDYVDIIKTLRRVKLLVDTNVLLPLEVLSHHAEERDTGSALRLAQLAQTAGVALYVHPDQDRDIERDKDRSRRELRKRQLQKYPRLPTAPRPTERQTKILGPSTTGSNDWVDQSLLAAVEAGAVDFLVTQDGRLQNRATRLGVGERVISLPDALQMLEMLFDRVVAPPPRVDSLVVYELRGSDPIFEGLREDYDGFDSWLDRIRTDHERPVWCISDFASGNYAGICIGKKQQDGEYGIPGKTLKLCTLSVAQGSSGFRFGELLLGTVFEYATANGYESIWVTVFAKHERLIELLETFGFLKLDTQTKAGELILVKAHKPTTTGVSPLEYNIRFGPRAFMHLGVPSYLVPIQPGFHRRLFPGAEPQIDFFAGSDPCGNAILKAYLCRSSILGLGEGDVLIFYRSQSGNQPGGATAVGVTEGVLRSTDTEALVDHVARRTVYSYEEIAGLSARGPVLSILFRLAVCRPWTRRVTIDRMVSEGVVQRAPQSIRRLSPEGAEWLLQHLVT